MDQLSKNTSVLLFVLLTGVLVVVAFISYNKILQFNKSVHLVMHSNAVKSKILEVVSNINNAEAAQRGYLLTDDSIFLQPFHGAELRGIRIFATLDSLVGTNPEQQQNLNYLKKIVSEKYLILNNNLKILKNTLQNSFADSALIIGVDKMDEIRKQNALMVQTEDKLLANHIQVKDRTATITPIFLLALSLFSILVITLFFFRLQKETSMRTTMQGKLDVEELERKQIEKSETKFRTLSETIPHMIWTATPEGRRNFFNKYFCDYTGLSFEALIGDGWQKVIFSDDLGIELEKWHNSLKTGEDFNMEKRIRHRDGTYRWHVSHGIAQKDDQGKITGWIGTSTEIEDQKKFSDQLEVKVRQRTAELEERKNFVETILETTKEYIAVYAKDFTLLALNKAAESMMGKKREELIGKKLLDILPTAEGRSETDLQRAFEGNFIHNEVYHSPILGRYIENYITPLKDPEGNIYAALAIANDVTNITLKQKEIEAANYLLELQNQTFELAEKVAKFGSYKWDVTTGALEYSDNLFRLLDCEPQAFVPTFEIFSSFIHPDDLHQVISNGEQTMQTGALVETPYRIISKTGKTKYLRSSGSFSGEGGNRLLIGTVQDISKDVEASKELKEKNLELENMNAELASFSYVASHDLQEPLRKIQGFSKRILDKDGEKLSDTTKDYFNRIRGAAQRMQNLIDSLLSFSRTNLSEAIFEKTDLNITLIEVQTVLNELLNQKNAVIESEDLPTLNAVPVQMHQLFLNLIGNSLKYSKPDVAPHIKIAVEKVTINEIEGLSNQTGEFWKITIRDNGIGFEQQYEHKIFELFQRLHGKTEYEGTGIGLAICKKIAQTHNGTIIATGQIGIGATFTFFLSDNNKS